MQTVAQSAAPAKVATPFGARQRRPPKPHRAICRHPELLAAVPFLAFQAGVLRVLLVLLTFADADGVAWPGLDELVRLTVREVVSKGQRRVVHYSKATIRRAVRVLREAGLLHWSGPFGRIMPFQRWPKRLADGSVEYGSGTFERHGGRVWTLNLAAIEAACVAALGTELTRKRKRSKSHAETGPGTVVAGAIMGDPSGPITDAPSSDRSLASLEPTNPLGSAAVAALGSQEASGTPRDVGSRVQGSAPTHAEPRSALLAPPADRSPSSPRPPEPEREGRESTACAAPLPDLLRPEELAADLDKLLASLRSPRRTLQ